MQMDDILLHPQTESALRSAITGRMHAFELIGNKGTGKKFTARYIAVKLLGIPPGKLEGYPYKLIIQPTANGSIGIDTVRHIGEFLKLRTTGQSESIKRLIIIEHAHLMTPEAQSSLLKTLEEPPHDTAIILTTEHPQLLLPTIHSRTQQITIQPPTTAQIQAIYGTKDKNGLNKALQLSGGNMGLLTALLTDADHPFIQDIAVAKEVLSLTVYQRLLRVSEFSSDRQQLRNLVMAIKHLSLAAIHSTKNKTDLIRWHKVLTTTNRANEHLDLSVNAKLLLTDLFVNM